MIAEHNAKLAQKLQPLWANLGPKLDRLALFGTMSAHVSPISRQIPPKLDRSRPSLLWLRFGEHWAKLGLERSNLANFRPRFAQTWPHLIKWCADGARQVALGATSGQLAMQHSVLPDLATCA